MGRGHTDDVVVPRPDVDVDGVEHAEEGEPPPDAVNDDFLAALEELVDDGSKEQEVNERPERTRGGLRKGRNDGSLRRTR